MTEVQQSDIYLLILGEKYGWEPSEDTVSVTHREYLTAKSAGKTILVYIQEGHKEPKQQDFCDEVQDYYNGFFRSTFTTPETLKDAIVQSLNQLSHQNNAETEASFKQALREAKADLQRSCKVTRRDGPVLQVAFRQQPVNSANVIEIEQQADDCFMKLCSARLASLSGGYDVVSEPTFTALATGNNLLAFLENGLVVIQLDPLVSQGADSFMDHSYVSPSHVKDLTLACSAFIEGYSSWCSVRLSGMAHKNFEELPDRSQSSFQINMTGSDDKEVVKLFTPYQFGDYEEWVCYSIEMLKRAFSC